MYYTNSCKKIGRTAGSTNLPARPIASDGLHDESRAAKIDGMEPTAKI